jgi:hypothetical protein
MHEYFFLHISLYLRYSRIKKIVFRNTKQAISPNLLWISVTNVVIFAQILLFLLHFRFRQKNINVQTGLYCSRRLLMGADKSKTQEVLSLRRLTHLTCSSLWQFCWTNRLRNVLNAALVSGSPGSTTRSRLIPDQSEH